ncbi:hypothetical protein TNCV_3651191 [Trichonephila clavipes]|nr:hypothetical protein TNCV_3651191 [Trichonephila clavipes]
MLTYHTQMPLPTASRWQHLSRKASRRRTAVLSPIRIKREENTSPQGFISAMAEFRKFFQDFPGILDAGKAFKMRKPAKIA